MLALDYCCLHDRRNLVALGAFFAIKYPHLLVANSHFKGIVESFDHSLQRLLAWLFVYSRDCTEMPIEGDFLVYDRDGDSNQYCTS